MNQEPDDDTDYPGEEELRRLLAVVGEWDGDTFRFREPLTMGNRQIRSMVIPPGSLSDLPPGVTRDDLIYSMLSPLTEIGEIKTNSGMPLGYDNITLPRRRDEDAGEGPCDDER